MPWMTGGQATVAALREHGVDVIFGVPGGHTLPLYDAMYGQVRLRHVGARHEQGAGYMAYGYAAASGKPGVVCTIGGPGITNAITPAANAYADSMPVLFVSSGPVHAATGRCVGALHELKDQFGLMRHVVEYSHVVGAVEEIPQAINDAFASMTAARPRPAYLQIPHDLLDARCEVDIPAPTSITPARPEASKVSTAAKLLQNTHTPLIIAGAGVTMAGANMELQQLAELLRSPVLLGGKSRDVLPTDHPLVIATTGYAMPDELIDLIAASDAALVVGSKLGEERTAGRRLPLPANLVHIDVDPTELGRKHPAAVGIPADARQTLAALLDTLTTDSGQQQDREQEIKNVRAAQRRLVQDAFGDSLPLLDAIRHALPTDAIVVADMTQLGYATARCLRLYQPHTFIHPSEFCAIGGGLPIGLGAKIANPERPVVVLAGDGGVVLNISELATAAQEKINLTMVVFNDHSYTAVKNNQAQRYNHRYLATDVLAPDFVALAKAYGAHAVATHDADQLHTAIKTAIDRPSTTMIEVPLPATRTMS